MDERLRETMTSLVKNSSPEELVGFIMTQVNKIQLLERKVGKLQQESNSWENSYNRLLQNKIERD